MEIDADESKDVKRWLMLKAKLSEENIKKAFKLFRENNIEPILIKGWAAACEYPESYQRIYADLDLCVSPDLFAESSKLISDEEGRKLNIDLHSGLRHLDTLEWDDLFNNSRLIAIDEVPVRILRAEDHLRVLCVHWLTDGGAFKERLLDIYYLIANHKSDFEWERCLGKISPTRREWILKTIGLTHKYYDLEIAYLPFADEVKNLPGWLVSALEKEWSADAKLKPLHTLLRNRRELWAQLKKRFPPNAIQATIDMEGEFNDRPRFYYQLGSIFVRLKPSFKRVYASLKILKRENK